MTGYGRAEHILEDKVLVVEIKSLNHRNLEISARLPNIFNSLEVPIKKKISERVSRGRIEITIRFDTDQGTAIGDQLNVNRPLIRNYYDLLTSIKEDLGLKDDITLEMIANLRNGIYIAEIEINPEEIWTDIEMVIERAIDTLLEMKNKEGQLLYVDFSARIDLIKDHLGSLELRAPQVLSAYQKRLTERLEELSQGVEIDESRLSQEIAIMAEKSDITEEIVRLESHINQLRDLLDSSIPVGRKMDFLFQEMHREINTIGSKSNDLDISGNVIEIKTELAKLREQVQNIE